jgi:hypothetical protein
MVDIISENQILGKGEQELREWEGPGSQVQVQEALPEEPEGQQEVL